MKPTPQPSGLQHGLAFLIAADWTPAQALAVLELLDDLRARIWQQYALHIQAQLQEQRSATDATDRSATSAPPF
jgi:hypothetical protein